MASQKMFRGDVKVNQKMREDQEPIRIKEKRWEPFSVKVKLAGTNPRLRKVVDDTITINQ